MKEKIIVNIKIEPYTIDFSKDNLNIPFTYWGIFLEDEMVSSTSTKEQAENTKYWMENWLNNTH
jgi:hypothetical protein